MNCNRTPAPSFESVWTDEDPPTEPIQSGERTQRKIIFLKFRTTSPTSPSTRVFDSQSLGSFRKKCLFAQRYPPRFRLCEGLPACPGDGDRAVKPSGAVRRPAPNKRSGGEWETSPFQLLRLTVVCAPAAGCKERAPQLCGARSNIQLSDETDQAKRRRRQAKPVTAIPSNIKVELPSGTAAPASVKSNV